MDQKRFFKRTIAVTAAVLAVAVLYFIAQSPYADIQFKKRTARLKAHITSIYQNQQKYLDETAKAVQSLPADPALVSRLQSEVLQKQVDVRLYLWMSTTAGEFAFGVPAIPFNKLNSFFDTLSGRIQNKAQVPDRNEFLLRYVDRYDSVNAAEPELFNFDIGPEERIIRYRDLIEDVRGSDWSDSEFVRPPTFVLSSPVYNAQSQILGNLFLKIDDSPNKELYYSKWRARRIGLFASLEPVMQPVGIISGLFLWFLLPTWVYLDGRRRDVKNLGVWVVLTVAANFFGLLIYLITRPAEIKTFRCPNCHREPNGTKSFCPYCGFDISKSFCQECQYPVKEDWEYCPSCKTSLKASKL